MSINKNIQIERFNKIYPWLSSFSDDLLFYIAINTLFFSVVKEYNANQIVLLTTISSLVSLILRVPIIKFISKIGNTISVRIRYAILTYCKYFNYI